jgi:hypothetical protein
MDLGTNALDGQLTVPRLQMGAKGMQAHHVPYQQPRYLSSYRVRGFAGHPQQEQRPIRDRKVPERLATNRGTRERMLRGEVIEHCGDLKPAQIFTACFRQRGSYQDVRQALCELLLRLEVVSHPSTIWQAPVHGGLWWALQWLVTSDCTTQKTNFYIGFVKRILREPCCGILHDEAGHSCNYLEQLVASGWV